MNIDDKLFNVIEKLQNDISAVKISIEVMSSKQEDILKSFDRSIDRMDDYSERLRIVEAMQTFSAETPQRLRKLESIQTLHKGYFTILGAALTMCSIGIAKLFLGG